MGDDVLKHMAGGSVGRWKGRVVQAKATVGKMTVSEDNSHIKECHHEKAVFKQQQGGRAQSRGAWLAAT